MPEITFTPIHEMSFTHEELAALATALIAAKLARIAAVQGKPMPELYAELVSADREILESITSRLMTALED